MKTKIIFIMFLALLSINVDSFAAFYAGSSFCSFNGILNSQSRTREEEFNMLLEPEENPNFEAMSSAVGALTVVPVKDLKNPECNVSKYTKDLLEFYKNNKDKIMAKHPEIAELLGFIQNRFESKQASEQ